MTASVMTVLGEVDADLLGVVLPHEHLIAAVAAQWEMPAADPDLLDALQPLTPALYTRAQARPNHYRAVYGVHDPLVAVEELKPFVEAGGRTVVDLTLAGIGRDPTALAAISRLAGVHVVMGCGEYVERSHSGYVQFCSAEQIRDVILAEIEHGVGQTGIRPGIIGEIGSGNPLTDAERKVLTGAAMAQIETGLALNIHRTVFPELHAAIEALELVLGLGVDPSRVVMSHCDERPEPEFALEVGRRGAWIELDTFGMEHWAANWRHPSGPVRRSYDPERVEIIARVLDAGHLDRILISQDVCMQTMLRSHGGGGYAHIDTDIVDRLLQAGVTQAEIDKIRIDNPRAMLTGEGL
ncbi:MAG: phosphotriesterase family protein [Solirubrobacteraceae bacterium]